MRVSLAFPLVFVRAVLHQEFVGPKSDKLLALAKCHFLGLDDRLEQVLQKRLLARLDVNRCSHAGNNGQSLAAARRHVAGRSHLHQVEVFGGVILIILGAMIMTNQFTRLAGYLSFLNRFAL